MFPRVSIRLVRLALLAAAVAVTVHGFRAGTSRLADFAGYYGAAQLLRSHHPPATLYNDEAFGRGLSSLGIVEPSIVMYVNPPTVAIPFLPLTLFEPFTAKALWLCFIVLLAAVAWKVTTASDDIPQLSAAGLAIGAFFLCSVPYLRNLQLGQLYLLLALLFAGAWFGVRRDRPLLTAACIGLAFALKFYGWLFPLLFLLQRRVRFALMTAAAMLLFTAVSVAVFGVEAYTAQIARTLGMAGAPDTASLSLRSVVAPLSRLFVYHAEYNPTAVAHLPWLPVLVPPVLLVLLFGWMARRKPADHETRFAATLVLSVLFTPLAADHHYILLALPAALLLTPGAPPAGMHAPGAMTLLAIFLLFGWLPAPPPEHLEGWWCLAAYWRTAGAFLLFALLLRNPRRTAAGASIVPPGESP